jgi:hypothetical protein
MAMNIKILLFLFEEMAKRKFNFKKWNDDGSER